MHLFIMHLSIADLLVAFCNVLPQMAWDITYRFQGNTFTVYFLKPLGPEMFLSWISSKF